MASIIKRKSTYAVVYWYLDEFESRKQKWETYYTRKEAKTRKGFVEYYQQNNGLVLVPLSEQYAKEIEDSNTELDDPGPDITVSEFLKIFVNIYGTSTWCASTFSSKQASIENYINPFIGHMRLSEITTKFLSKYYNDLLDVPEVPRANGMVSGRCVQPANIKKINDIIRCALNQAIRWEYLDTNMRNPATLAILPKAQKNRRDVWSIDTFKKALSLAEDDLLLLCLHLAFSCSLRIGEINGLDWNNVIIDDESIKTGNARVIINRELTRVSLEAMQKLKERDIIYIFPTQKPHATTRLVLKTPKTESSNRVVWLPTSVALLLKQHYSDQKELKEFLGDAYNDYNLVIALDNGNPVESRIVRKRFDALCAKNDLKPVVFHSLRHLSTGYKLKLTNGDIKSVQGDTGHAESDMVLDIYSRVLDEDRRQNAQKMDQKFYNTLSDVEVESSNTDYNDENFLKDLMGFLSIDSNRAQLQNMMNQANKK